jgi:hypothetical protein
MPHIQYQITETDPQTACEPEIAYGRVRPTSDSTEYALSNIEYSNPKKWNPNVPFHGTQEEWWEHFHKIEEGNFMTIEEADKKFEAWKTNFLTSHI